MVELMNFGTYLAVIFGGQPVAAPQQISIDNALTHIKVEVGKEVTDQSVFKDLLFVMSRNKTHPRIYFKTYLLGCQFS